MTWKPSITWSNPSFRNVAKASVPARLLEEETLPGYDPDDIYPVRLGDLIADRYRVIGKLGYGANSTVWFCRDER
jgi:serine/threonine-protein kinase SRPK3